MRLARRSLEVARAEGVRGLWWRGLGVTVYRRLIVFAHTLVPNPEPPATGLPLEAELLDESGVDDYLRLRPDTAAAEVRRRLAEGERSIVIRHRGEIVAARWFATGRAQVDYLELSFELPDGVVFLYDQYTAPAARRLGMYAVFRAFSHPLLIGEGRRTLVSGVMPENAAGQALVARAGHEPVGWVGCLRLGPVRVPVRRCPVAYLGRARRLRV